MPYLAFSSISQKKNKAQREYQRKTDSLPGDSRSWESPKEADIV